jgi:hypothetical protein
MNKTFLALMRLRPNCEFSWIGENLADVVWLKPKNTTTPTQSEIETEITKMEQEAASIPNEKAALLAKLGITADEAALLLS